VKRVSIRRLVLVNFRSFKGRHEIEFPESGLVILRGRNLDTRGDSGAGKTNILLALAFAFRYAPHSAKALQCWWTEEPMRVEVHMDTDAGPVILTRGDKLTITVNGEITAGSAKAVEAKLDEICGVSADLREILTYRHQIKPKKFMAMSDKDMKKFLVQVLGLEGLEKEIETRVRALTALERSADSEDSKLEPLETELAIRVTEAEPPSLQDLSLLEAARARLQAKLLKLQAALNTAIAEQAAAKAADLAIFAKKADKWKEPIALAEKKKALLRLTPFVFDTAETDRLQGLLSQCQSHIDKTEAQVEEARKKHQAEAVSLRVKVQSLTVDLVNGKKIESELAKLREDAKQLKNNVCPVCERVWDHAQARLGENQTIQLKKLSDLDAIKEVARALKHAEDAVSAHEFVADPRLEKLRSVHRELTQKLRDEQQKERSGLALHESEINRQVAVVDAEIEDLKRRRSEEIAEALADPDLPSEKLEIERKRLADLVCDATAYKNEAEQAYAVAAAENKLRSVNHLRAVAARAAAEERVKEQRKLAKASRQAWRQESDYLDLLRGFRNKIFDEVLEEIGVEATDIIGGLPNAQHISIQFRSDRVTDAGTVQERITPVTFLYGEERSLEEAVSGGQATSIDLAVDLAVSRVISARLGCKLNWLTLDETFEGHDRITKASCLEILQKYANDKLIIIVDHMSEFKEAFSKQIEVVFEGKLSHIS
jgi:DNA repair exonuclease SbcCD ATPase subunit